MLGRADLQVLGRGLGVEDADVVLRVRRGADDGAHRLVIAAHAAGVGLLGLVCDEHRDAVRGLHRVRGRDLVERLRQHELAVAHLDDVLGHRRQVAHARGVDADRQREVRVQVVVEREHAVALAPELPREGPGDRRLACSALAGDCEFHARDLMAATACKQHTVRRAPAMQATRLRRCAYAKCTTDP